MTIEYHNTLFHVEKPSVPQRKQVHMDLSGSVEEHEDNRSTQACEGTASTSALESSNIPSRDERSR